MITLLLSIIYLAFISLGLPDSLLGSAWPAMQVDFAAPLSLAGLVSMITSGGTIVSSLLSGRIIRRFGTGKVTLVSVFMTAIALLGFSFAPSFIWLCIVALPLGLGAGAVDSVLNNFVAVHYNASQMSWLHCFWGIGATLGPIIMSFYMGKNNNWSQGYLTISVIQFCLVAVLFVSLPLWRKLEKSEATDGEEDDSNITNQSPFKIPGVKLALLSFLCYCAVETTTGLWGSSYLVNQKGLSTQEAARWIALYYGGITIGRFLTGFVTLKIKSHIMIRIGQFISALGALVLLLPLPVYFTMIGLILIGLGCAPIFPCMIHETPNRFGKGVSQSIMGLQMAFAYIGSTFMPPLFGIIAGKSGVSIFPFFLLFYILFMFLSSEKINVFMKSRQV